jgi:hypothetical protein
VPYEYDAIVDPLEDGCDGLDVGVQIAQAARSGLELGRSRASAR